MVGNKLLFQLIVKIVPLIELKPKNYFMKKQFVPLTAVIAILFVVSSCDPVCNECNDPKLVKILRTDTSKPTFQWSFSSGNTGTTTATSSIAIVSNPSAGVDATIALGLNYGVYVDATDNESGIKSLKFIYRTSSRCRNGAGIIILDGGEIERMQDFAFTNCALKSWSDKELNIENMMSCRSGALADGVVIFTVIAENFAGLIETSTMTVRCRPATL